MKLFTASLRLAALAFLLLGAVDTVVASVAEGDGLRERRGSRAGAGLDVQLPAAPGGTAGSDAPSDGTSDGDSVEALVETDKDKSGVPGEVVNIKVDAGYRAAWRAFLAADRGEKYDMALYGIFRVFWSPLLGLKYVSTRVVDGAKGAVNMVASGCRRGCPRRAVSSYDAAAVVIADRYAAVEAWLVKHPKLKFVCDYAPDATARAYYILTVVALVTGSVPACASGALMTLDPATLLANVPTCLAAVPVAFQAPVAAMVASLIGAIEAAPEVGTQLVQRVTGLFGRGQGANGTDVNGTEL